MTEENSETIAIGLSLRESVAMPNGELEEVHGETKNVFGRKSSFHSMPSASLSGFLAELLRSDT